MRWCNKYGESVLYNFVNSAFPQIKRTVAAKLVLKIYDVCLTSCKRPTTQKQTRATNMQSPPLLNLSLAAANNCTSSSSDDESSPIATTTTYVARNKPSSPRKFKSFPFQCIDSMRETDAWYKLFFDVPVDTLEQDFKIKIHKSTTLQAIDNVQSSQWQLTVKIYARTGKKTMVSKTTPLPDNSDLKSISCNLLSMGNVKKSIEVEIPKLFNLSSSI